MNERNVYRREVKVRKNEKLGYQTSFPVKEKVHCKNKKTTRDVTVRKLL